MHRLVAAVAASVTLVALAPRARACGAAVIAAPGSAGTAYAEGAGQLSLFVADANGYAWDRLKLSDGSRTHVATIAGQLTGSIETDARADRAIAAQNGVVVELSAKGVTPISSDPNAATTVFGAALDPEGKWQVLTYRTDTQMLALFSEGADGAFTAAASLSAACGTPEMLDVVVEPDGTLVGKCAHQAVLRSAAGLTLADLPAPALGLGKASDGTALFYGSDGATGDLLRMKRAGQGWAIDDRIATLGAQVQWIIPVGEDSLVASTTGGFYGFDRSTGSWQRSDVLSPPDPVTSAFGAPAQVLTGKYELTMWSWSGHGWTSQDLGKLGTPPVYKSESGAGCQEVGGFGLLPALAALLAVGARRRRTR